MKHAFISLSIILAMVLSCAAKLTVEQQRQLPAAVTDKVEFARDIQPIFEASCVKCHGRGKENGGFRLDTRETFLKGRRLRSRSRRGPERRELSHRTRLRPRPGQRDAGERIEAERAAGRNAARLD